MGITPKEVDEWVAIISNRGAVVVIATLVIVFCAATLWLLWGLMRDLLPEVKSWFSEMKQSTIANKENLKGLHDTLRDQQAFHRQVAEDRRHCMTNTQIALLGSKVAGHLIEGHPKEHIVKPIINEMNELALDAFMEHPAKAATYKREAKST
jgi:hypothetical protein